VDTYAYLNAILDANASITRLVLPSAVYAVVVGPVPAGQPSIPSRVACEEAPEGTATSGYEGSMLLFHVEVTP
jgi:hypothetical protein